MLNFHNISAAGNASNPGNVLVPLRDRFDQTTFERFETIVDQKVLMMMRLVTQVGWILLILSVVLLIVHFQSVKKYGSSEELEESQLPHDGEIASGRALAHSSKPENVAQNKQRKSVHKQLYIPYSEAENVVKKVATKWGDFINFVPQVARTKPYIKSSVMKSLQQCPTPTTPPIVCKESMNDHFIASWKTRKVSDLCEENAASKINCYDSFGKSRFCVFENAMMNFAKVRKKKVDGHTARSWERGFLSAECGDMAPDDIGYLPLYKPDIEGREEARCDYVFNETVLAYSHENIRNYASMSNDYMNVWSMLWLSGVSHVSRDVTFLNIDGIKRGRYFNDLPNQFFRTYNVSFRRILRASDFADTKATLCFKKLLMQPRPVLQFGSETDSSSGTSGGVGSTSSGGSSGGGSGGKCTPVSSSISGNVGGGGGGATRVGNSGVSTSVGASGVVNKASDKDIAGMSSLFQRWNLQVRHNYQLLTPEALPSPTTLRVLLISRSPPLSGPNSTHILSRMYTNTNEILQALQLYAIKMNKITSESSDSSTSGSSGSSNSGNTSGSSKYRIEITHSVFSSLSIVDQVTLMSESSVVIGMHGAGIASTIHMPLGSKLCCGVVEIFPEGEFKSIKGYNSLSRKLGYQYERVNILPQHTLLQGTQVEPTLIVNALHNVIQKMNTIGGSCFLSEVLNMPYL